MTEIGSDRRRKRSSQTTAQSSSSSRALILALSACLFISLLLTISIEEDASSSSSSSSSSSLSSSSSSSSGQRDGPLSRRLDADIGGEAGGGEGENVWKKQQRVRKRRERQLLRQREEEGTRDKSTTTSKRRTDDNSRSMAVAAAEMDADLNVDVDGTRRMAIIPRYADKHHFNECVGKTIEQCQALVDAYVKSHPAQFDGRSTLWLDIRKIRELTDDSYYKVVLRTNVPGTRVMGLFDDGMVYYPWKWRVNGADVTIGPWNCKVSGAFLSPADCCAKIQGDVTQMDDAGNYLACFVEEPVGGPNNPERDDRAIVVTDATGKVARAPVAH